MSNKLQSLIQQAEKLRSQNNLLESLEVYKKICKLDKNNLNAWMIYGSVAGNVNKLDVAESAFRQACKIQTTFGKQHELLLQVLELRGSLNKAIGVLLGFSESKTEPTDIALRIGVLYGKAENFEDSITWLKKYIAAIDNNAYAYHCIASAYQATNNLEEAERQFKNALSINPNDHVVLNNYAALLQKMAKTEQAIEAYRQSIASNNQYPISQYNLADLLLLLGETDEALELFTNAVSLKPDYIEALVGQGRCYHASNVHLYAIEVFKKAIDINPSFQNAYIHIAHTQISLAQFDDAIKSLNTAIELDPSNITAQCTLSEVYEKRGEYIKSEEIIRPLLSTHSDHKDVVIAYSSLCKKLDECDKAVELINQAAKNNLLPPLAKASLHFKAGKILDSMKKYDDAFGHFASANKEQSFNYDSNTSRRALENVTTLFSSDAIESLQKSSVDSKAPIFVVGMPRSGTTLVEQILASHPEVYGAGELPYMTTLSRRVAGDFFTGAESVHAFSNIEINYLNTLTSQYIQTTMEKVGNETFFTDKMPHNFQLIGIINILFPESRIINCTRNPIDNCLSINFSEFNSMHSYANDLANLAEYYTGYYQNLMTHWGVANRLPLYNIAYEDLVENQEAESRKLLEFCGLDWHDECLNFHKSNRDVATISYDQVRQPIYKRSVARWRNYEKHITPLIEHFQEYI